MRRIEGAAGSPAPRDPLHEGRDPFFSTLLGTPRRSSLRLPLSLPGSFASLATITRTDS